MQLQISAGIVDAYALLLMTVPPHSFLLKSTASGLVM